jgi:hypothetical protein
MQLTHNVHGPHDQHFYKMLSELETEWYELKRSGYSGEGFHGRGTRLGQSVSHNVPLHHARSKAIEAAEKRKRQQDLMGSSKTLGGNRDLRSPRELAAAVCTSICSRQ